MRSSKKYIDTTGWKSFKLHQICDVEHVQKMKMNGKSYIKDYEIISDDGHIPYIAAISRNNGITGYSTYDANNKGDCITLSTTADSAKTVFYQEHDFIGRQQIAGIRLKNNHYMGIYVGLFLVSCIKRLLSKYNWGTKLTIDNLRKLDIELPANANGNPDWEYMESFMTEVVEHERSRIKQFKDVRNKPEYVDVHKWDTFKINQLFSAENGNTDIKKKDLCNIAQDNIPVLSAGFTDFGIIGQTELPAKIHAANTITIDMFGNVFYRNFPYKMVTHARIFSLSLLNGTLNENTGNFLATVLKPILAGFDYDNMCSFNKIVDKEILLPVDADGNPDWDYMNGFMNEIIKRERERERLCRSR